MSPFSGVVEVARRDDLTSEVGRGYVYMNNACALESRILRILRVAFWLCVVRTQASEGVRALNPAGLNKGYNR